MDDNTPDSGDMAFGRPGISPRWTSSAKEGVGLHTQLAAVSGSPCRTAF